MWLQKLFILLFFSYVSLFADIYAPFKLNGKTSNNYFMTTNFEEIIRFRTLKFINDELDSDSSEYIDEISEKIQNYIQNGKLIHISIIGHSYTSTKEENLLKSKGYTQKIQSYFKDKGIDSNLTVLEARGSQEPSSYPPSTSSNRVVVSMYIEFNEDEDKDGVLMHKDNCPNSKPGVKVSEDGCKIATIIMLMDNDKEKNAIAVKSGKQELIIDEPNTYTSIKSKNEMSVVSKMSDQEINSLFGNVVASSNSEHFKFILYFEKTKLQESSKEVLNEMINFISKKDDYYIKVSGYADTIGSSISNKRLSQERVDSIVQIIKENKLKYFHLSTEAHGETQLIIPTEDNTNEFLNRRVEVLIY